MKNIPFVIIILFSFLNYSCQKEAIPDGQISDSLWLEHKGAQMPILVEGNISSGTLILILHGGPGGSTKPDNKLNKSVSEPLEERYAVAYYDQRLSGNSRGNFEAEIVTAAQMVEDVDVVIDLLKDQYGSDLNIFLYGISWGGYLGNAYLSTDNNQQKVRGWIDAVGAHNVQKIGYDGVALMEEVATQQIAANSSQKEGWQEILDYVAEFDAKTNGRTITLDEDISLEVNAQAFKAMDLARADSLLATPPQQDGVLNAYLLQDHNVMTSFWNKFQMSRTALWEEILTKPLSDKLQNITLPSLLIFGKYDFVVPPSLGEEMLLELGTPEADKSLHIFEHSGHGVMLDEPEKFVDLVVQFVEQYR
ncbi:MAG: alpha/beta hydrolase [Bacteroidota bacterium]